MVQITEVGDGECIQGASPAVNVIGAVEVMQPFGQRIAVDVRIVELAALAQGPLIDHRYFSEPLAARLEVFPEAFGGKHGGQQYLLLPMPGPGRRLVHHIERRP